MTQQTAPARLPQSVGVHDHTLGRQMAAVTVIQYGDYECTRCGQAHAVVREARARLGDRLRLVYRHFPLIDEHPHAQNAAEAAEAAGAQGKFWEMHNALFEHQNELGGGFLVEYADALGLNATWFLRDLASHVYAERVRGDRQGGIASGVSTVPAFFINGDRYDHSWDGQALLEAIQDRAAPLNAR